MDKAKLTEALKKLRADSKKRKFNQSIELIFTLQNLDLKKPDQQVEFFANIPHQRGRPVKICALIGPELKEEATKVCDKFITQEEFADYDKKKAKELADEFDFFIAQANIMGKIATTFGKIFGPRGKMPNPKAGCIVPPKASLKPVYDKLQKTLKISAKTQLQIQCRIGAESLSDDHLIDNIQSVYTQLTHHLPSHENNIKASYIKLTMSKPIKV
ncbi:50S ribosomal protein L1 [Candidatus Woesearchaeota archaeon CG10_big_fil_rev_8_21_14_0_10_34_8]|nr:MAG: 50S ribosomal protein L1 [Candidatus Woesearchaeota archaeon CG10_big_fil_rev_8_21_14_0_10_34_8]